jgi:hypothetical protein
MLKYEKPQIIDLTYDGSTASGANCSVGSRNTSQCQDGILATGTKCANGTGHASNCITGGGT